VETSGVSTASGLESARAAYQRHDWVTARTELLGAQAAHPLDADDLYALANCSWWLGDVHLALPTLQAAYRQFLTADQPHQAALIAIEIGYTFGLRGDVAQCSGWMSRAQRLLQDQPEAAAHGYLTFVGFESAFDSHAMDEAMTQARHVQEVGLRHSDPTLSALGVLGEGRVLVRQGHVSAGMALLDEAMVAATSDELDPGWAGSIYCHLMSACAEISDLRRASEWTGATAQWCERMPGAGPFMGICRVHRAEVLQARGRWADAEHECERVCEEEAHFNATTVAEANYFLGELRRRRGDLAGADAAFRDAHSRGRDPQPGLALLRLDEGDPDAATALIQAALRAAESAPLTRWRLLLAAVEIALAAGDVAQAVEFTTELDEISATYPSNGLTAEAQYARGTVLLASGNPEHAGRELRAALHHWQDMAARHETARVRMALARAYEELGDADNATLERQAATAEFAEFRTRAASPPDRPGGLTDRESEVLDLVAKGLTNQQVAGELFLSVRTVERHLATIYQKLGVGGRSARAAAVSFALRHGDIT
jgi:ATP/maltotriose-dependent transcriptional regulator MalT